MQMTLCQVTRQLHYVMACYVKQCQEYWLAEATDIALRSLPVKEEIYINSEKNIFLKPFTSPLFDNFIKFTGQINNSGDTERKLERTILNIQTQPSR